MTFSAFARRISVIFAIFGFAYVANAVVNAHPDLLVQGFMALLPMVLVGVLLARMAMQNARKKS